MRPRATCVSSLLSICAALTPSVLRLLPTITWYLTLVWNSPLSQTPEVYDPRKNSSAISRSSTPSQYGNWPSVLRTRRQRRDADADADEAVEGPGQVARAHDLRRVALRGVRRPDVEVVAHLRREEPARERREELLQLDVLAPLNGLRVAEGVDVGLVQVPLVQISSVAEEPEIHLALGVVDEQEADIRNVREGLGLGRLRLDGWAGAEFGAAAIRYPDARLVVAPGPAKETRRLARRSQQHDALRGVGLTLCAVAEFRRARNN